MRVTPRGKRRSQKTRLGVALASALAIAVSLSGLALASEPPRTDIKALKSIPSASLTLRPGRVPPLVRPTFARAMTAASSTREQKTNAAHLPYTFPFARRLIDRAQLDRPHHDYPAWDVAVPVGTRVVAVRGGVIEEVTQLGRCGNGVVVEGTDGFDYTYCHGLSVRVSAGDRVETGQLIMLSGSSGHSTGPHLHLQIESPTGGLLCPQSLVSSWFNGGHASPSHATSAGCFYVTKEHRRKHHRHHQKHHRHRHQGSERPGAGDGTREAGGGGSGTSSPTPTPSPSPSPTKTARPQPTASPSPTPLILPSPTPT